MLWPGRMRVCDVKRAALKHAANPSRSASPHRAESAGSFFALDARDKPVETLEKSLALGRRRFLQCGIEVHEA